MTTFESNTAATATSARLMTPVRRMVDPGEAGWPDKPKVTPAERALYGALAESVRLLGAATTAASDAYALACESALTEFDSTQDGQDFIDNIIRASWDLQARAREALRMVAAQAIERTTQFTNPPGIYHEAEPIHHEPVTMPEPDRGVRAG